MCDITDEIEVVPTHVPRRKRHPVINASINNFNDGQDVFIVDGNEYIAKSVGVDNLRRFASKSKVKTSSISTSISQQGWTTHPNHC
jgi:hypothetical protein